MSLHWDIAILGGGMAGTFLVESLLQQGVSASTLLHMDAHPQGCGGASSVPGALLQPIPGRSLVTKPGYIEAYQFAARWLEELGQRTEPPCYRKLPILRPIIPEHRAAKQMRKTYHRRGKGTYGPLVQDVCLDANQTRQNYPILAPVEQTVVFTPAYSVHLPPLLEQLHKEHRAHGVQQHHNVRLEKIVQTPEGWELQTTKGARFARRVVLALGVRLREWFPQLPIHQTAGEVLLAQAPAHPPLDCIVSAGGHIAPLPDGRWVLGATYYPNQASHDLPPDIVQETIFQRTEQLIPTVRETEPETLWFGIRAVLRGDRQPTVGEIPRLPGLYALGCFASKGLFWSPWLAHRLACTLQDSTHEMPIYVDPKRLPQEQWTPHPDRFLLAPN